MAILGINPSKWDLVSFGMAWDFVLQTILETNIHKIDRFAAHSPSCLLMWAHFSFPPGILLFSGSVGHNMTFSQPRSLKTLQVGYPLSTEHMLAAFSLVINTA